MTPAAKPTVHVVLNPQSGRGLWSVERVRALFASSGIEVQADCVRSASEAALLARQAVQAGADIVVAGGGDGTINTVAAALIGKPPALGVLPMGTLNHFAKDLKIPMAIEEAVLVIARRHTSNVDVGEVNGHIFLNNSSLGLYPSIVMLREQMKRDGLNKWVSLSFATIGTFVRMPHLELRMVAGGREVHLTTPFVFVGNNRYEVRGPRLGERESLHRGELFLSVAPGLGRVGLLRITLAALRSTLTQSDGFDQECVTEFSVHSPHRHSRVSIDGEVRRIANPLHYITRPGALRVCVPGP